MQSRQIKAIVLRHRNTSLPLMAHRLKCTVYKGFDFNGRCPGLSLVPGLV